jgi:hypothetical protein
LTNAVLPLFAKREYSGKGMDGSKAKINVNEKPS